MTVFYNLWVCLLSCISTYFISSFILYLFYLIADFQKRSLWEELALIKTILKDKSDKSDKYVTLKWRRKKNKRGKKTTKEQKKKKKKNKSGL